MKLRQKAAVAIAAISLASVAGVGPANAASIGGGGASFLANMMDICAAQYNRNTQSNTASDIVTYASVGSSAGKTGFQKGTYLFGGSESAYAAGSAVPAGLVYVPLVGGAIAIGYRLDGISPANATVRLSSELVAKIFAGQITRWSDTAIAAANKATTAAKKLKSTKDGVTASVAKKASNVEFLVTMTPTAAKKYKNAKVTISAAVLGGESKSIYSAKSAAKLSKSQTYAANTVYTVKAGKTLVGTLTTEAAKDGETITFPDTAIRVVHRSDGSGTTNNFINFLNKSFPSIWTKPASDTYSTGFPTTLPSDGSFQSAKGNEGLASYVRDNNGAITYAELSYLEERGVKAAAVSNPAGKYVLPSPETSAVWLDAAIVAADGLVTQDFAAKAADAYPINAVSYGLSTTAVSATNASVKSFFKYFLDTCAPKNAAAAGYTPLTGSILTKADAQVAKINVG